MSQSSANKSNASDRRSKLLVDPEVQTSLIRRIVLHWCIFIVAAFILVGLLQACIEHPQGDFFGMLRYVLAKNALALCVTFALLPMFIYDTIRVTNRFAGPVARLRGMLRLVAEGQDFNELKLRKGDFWMELANEFTNAVGQLRQPRKVT